MGQQNSSRRTNMFGNFKKNCCEVELKRLKMKDENFNFMYSNLFITLTGILRRTEKSENVLYLPDLLLC